MMADYQASIKNITTGEWLQQENGEIVTFSEKLEERLIFHDEEDAELTLFFLNDTMEDCFTLMIEEVTQESSSE